MRLICTGITYKLVPIFRYYSATRFNIVSNYKFKNYPKKYFDHLWGACSTQKLVKIRNKCLCCSFLFSFFQDLIHSIKSISFSRQGELYFLASNHNSSQDTIFKLDSFGKMDSVLIGQDPQWISDLVILNNGVILIR